MNLKIADKSGEIKDISHMRLPDSIIIASSILEQASCVITNDGGFDKAKNLIPVYTSEEFFKEYIKQDDNDK